MAENESIALEQVEQPATEQEEVVSESHVDAPNDNKKPSFGAKIKEFFRKQIVNLKRKPQRIAFFFLAIVTIYNLLTLASFSEAIIEYAEKVELVGLMVFVNTLLSILVLVTYLNAFPKLRKPKSKIVIAMSEGGATLNINILMVVGVLLMVCAMIACEAVYYDLMNTFYVAEYTGKVLEAASQKAADLVHSTLVLSITHIVLLGVFVVLFLTLPLYRKLIMKINTKVVVESATGNIKEIDLQD